MRLTKNQWFCAGKWIGMCLIGIALASTAHAQAFSTTTVQGTVYLANGVPGAGTLQLSWPAFTTANNQTVTAGRTTTTIGADGFVSVNLAPNLGSMPAGLFYTATYNMSDGTTSTEYWVVPAAAQATIGQVRSQVMPAAQAVHAVSKAYVDQAIQSLSQNYLAPSGGTLSGPLYLNSDPTQAMQAADKHYVDSTFSQAVPLAGANMTGPLTSVQLGAAWQADQFAGADFGSKLQACLAVVSQVNGGTCDARNFSGNQSMASNLTISTANTTVMLPCATISTANQIIVTAGTRNVALRGCALRGASNASGSQGGTAFLYSGAGAMVQVGDPTYTADTLGFHLDNVVINTTAANNSTAQGLTAYRTQEMDLQSLYFLGNSNQTGMTLDGTGNYTGGTFYDNEFSGFQTAVNAIGHQVSNPAATDWLNASTFVRLHIDCPTSGGSPINGTFGINLQQGDGNTFTGGDVEGCNTALHLGPNAQNNTIVGLRNENSNNQVAADSGSSYNNWITGGTMFTGKLADNGTRNSFLDTFHRSFNGMNGDWYGSQQDATITNHFRLGTGNGNERGLLNRYQSDYGYRWTTGLSDATAGEQFYQVLDELNNVYRLSIGQYNNGQSSSNNQTVINAAGTGAVVLNGSSNAGTGGVVIGSGGTTSSTVATINNAGNAQFNGTLQVSGTSTFAGSTTVRNQADAEIDAFLWAGATANQKESLTYKDYTGVSQWYMVEDASNNWALNSATGGLDSFKAYQSTNSGDTYINASSTSGVVRVNYENGAGTGFNIYGGNSGTLYAGFTGTTSIKFPGLAAGSGHNCLQIDNSGYITNTGSGCGTGSGSGTVNSGTSGQIAYYSGAGTALSGMSSVPVSAGGTGATSAAGALTSLGAASLTAAGTQSFAGPVNAPALNSSVNSQINVMAPPYNAKGDCVTDDHDAIQAAMSAAATSNPAATVYFPTPPGSCYLTSTLAWTGVSLQGQAGLGMGNTKPGVSIQGKPGQDVFNVPSPSTVTTAAPLRSWSVRDIHITVDDSSAGSFTHRWPGRWVSDGAMTSGSAVFTSSNSMISCGDVGQAIQVNGAGASGANLVTTIASVFPCWAPSSSSSQTITLAASASTTVSAAAAYISVAGLPVTTNIGACGIAFDDIDGKAADNTMTGTVGNGYDTIRDVSFSSVGGGYGKNNTCAMFFQGQWGPYGLDARNVNFGGTTFGVVEGSPETNSNQTTSGNDYQKWDHGIWGGTYPWISYNGGDNKIEDIQVQAKNGPQILQYANIYGDIAATWLINIPEFAHVSGGTYGFRIEGLAHILMNTSMVADTSYSQTAYFDASDSQCINCGVIGALVINGSHDRFTLTNTLDPAHLNDVGLGNTVSGSFQSSPVYGYPVGRYYTENITRGDKPAGTVTDDFIQSGNVATPYKSGLDLFFWPDDFTMNGGGGNLPAVMVDSSSLTGRYLAWYQNLTVSKFTNAMYLNNGGTALIGSTMVPATQATVYISATCPAITSFTFSVMAGSTSIGSVTPTCSTAYATSSVTVNMASYSGQALGFKVSGTGGTWSGVDVAYIAVSPFSGATSFSGLNQHSNLNPAALHATLPGNNYFGPVANQFLSNTYTTQFPQMQSYEMLGLYDLHLDAGINQNQDGLTQFKPGITPFSIISESHTGGSTNPIALTNYQYSEGDTFGIFNLAYCYGGTSAGGDEGCENNDEWTFEGNVDYNGPITAGGSTGSTLITVNPSQGVGTQGTGRWLLDLNAANLITTGKIASISRSSYTTYTGSGTSWPVSTVNTTLGTAVNGLPGVYTVTPASMTGITTSSVLCIADGGNFQTVQPTATTGTTFTAYFYKPQVSTAIVSAGGLCGYYVGIDADQISGNGVIGTMLIVYPVIRSTSSTSMDVSITHQGNWSSYTSAFSSADGTYVLYPGAEVLHVNNGGTVLSNVLGLAPNTVAWANGNTVDHPIYPDITQQGGNSLVTRYTPGGWGRNYTFGPYFSSTGSSAGLFNVMNNTAGTFYNTSLNRYGPTLMSITGYWPQGLQFNTYAPPAASQNGAIVYKACPLAGCGWSNIFTSYIAGSGNDSLQYNSSTGGWQFTYGFGAGTFAISATGAATGLTVASTTSLQATGSNAANIYPGSTASVDLAIKAVNQTTNNFLFNDNGSITGNGLSTANITGFNALTVTGGVNSPSFSTADGKFAWWDSESYFYLKDVTDSTYPFDCKQGAGTTSFCQAIQLQVGSGQQTTWDANGLNHQAGTPPTASAGTLTGTNAGGYVASLSTATTVTVTFANSGWTTWASCVANTSVASTQPYVSAISKTAVTFTFASLTGTLYYNCVGN